MNTPEQEKFDIKSLVEETPFESLSAQAFLKKWGEMNDGVKIEFLPRKEWEVQKETGLFQKNKSGKEMLFLPEDLHLWEMVGIMEEVDQKTFSENPEKWLKKKVEMNALGKMFKNAGAYISERLSSVEEGKEIAEAMAEEFSSYGNLLVKEVPGSTELTPEETQTVDEWFLGKNIAVSRMGKVEDPEEKEEARKEAIAQFFRVAEKAFALKKRELPSSEEGIELWKKTTPIHSSFLQKVERSIEREVEKPKWEMSGAIFRSGIENILKNLERPDGKKAVSFAAASFEKMFGKKAVASFFGEKEKLVESLHLSDLKNELEETRRSGNADAISLKESQIAFKIQRAVSSFPYRSNSNNPAEIVAEKYINCVGASTIGGALLSEVGIKYLVGAVPEHSVTLLVTSDGKVIWQDMLNPHINEELTDALLEGKNWQGKPLSVADIAEFSKNPSSEGLMFDIKGEMYRKKVPSIDEGSRQYITVFPPETGQQIQILSNTASTLSKLGNYEEAIEACRQVISLSPKYLPVYNNLGYSLAHLGREEEALAVYKKALDMNSEYSLAYDGIGQIYFQQGRFKESKEVFEKAVSVHSKDPHAHFGLGRTLMKMGNSDEAMREFNETISLNHSLAEPYFYLAELSLASGKKEEAIASYEDFLARADEKTDPKKIMSAKESLQKLKINN